MKWLDINDSSPPKDGTVFVSCNTRQGGLMAVTWWSPVFEYWKATGGLNHYQFTHWMPLPAPPETES